MIDRTTLSTVVHLKGRRDRKRTGILLDILFVMAPLLLIGPIGEYIGDGTPLGAVLINLAYVLSVVIATAMLKARGNSWREIGLARPASWPKTVLLGIVALVGFIAASLALQVIVSNLLAPGMAPSDTSSFDPLYGNLPLLILYLAAAWTTIGFGEEMIFRAFLINSLADLFQGARARWVFGLLGSSILFGLAHFSWGLAGIIETTLLGLVLGFVYLRSGRNLWVTIIAHGLGNTLSFILVYAGLA